MKNKNIISRQEFSDFEKIRSNFLKIICSELRTPVGAIIGFTEILKENIHSEDNQNILDTISLSSVKIKELSDTALMISQIDAEKPGENMRPTKINSIIEYAISDIYEELNNKNIKINLLQTDLTTEIVIDPDLIKEAIEVFLKNAVSTSQPNSTISIKITENSESVALTINYPLEGIRRDEFITISEYFTGDLKTTRFDWPGLKLVIARFIMDLHDAEIKIFDNTGTGAKVCMIFPINKAKQHALHQLLSQLN